ncbi:ScbR family autoregulator-binding transcription factor [Mycobacterium sp.]|jgi:AcrR family transcriptional regulator|uniref:ScbR family autoregulator-binding transcription factor n=1 Tax=Mycobacterium sp. TaxID=1785 RepID=UPI002D272854|nr:ScbR family autoregulator-binding transcription factor [Mycobacterium sp.]HZA10401.1 ScbR family autoregulator-binding transcription factor [Mycobacterium sp.]
MGRQARAEATRRKIINAAVGLFDELGYPATGLGEIIERAELTKGALYYHFDSKESLAAAIVDEGSAKLLDTFLNVCQSSSPALESLIHGTLLSAGLIGEDKAVRTGGQLTRALGQFNEAVVRGYGGWYAAVLRQVRQAQAEGDLRDDLDPDTIAETVQAAMGGAEMMSNASSGGRDLVARLIRIWGILLPAIVSGESLPYFREFLSRASLRHQPPLSIE